MKQLRWIAFGVIGGALYSCLVSISLARSLAVAWPAWYAAYFDESLGGGHFIWDNVVVWLPCFSIAVLIGLGFRKALREKAIPAAFIGAGVCFLYAVVGSTANGLLSAGFNKSVFVIIATLPLGVLLANLHSRSFITDAGDAGAR